MTFKFTGKIWKYEGKGGWYFLTLPKETSKQIRQTRGHSEEGWGRLKAVARIADSEWQTAIWYDTKFDAYLLPVKSKIREANRLVAGSKVTVRLFLQDEENILRSWKQRAT